MSNPIWYVVYDSMFFIAITGIVCGGVHYALKSCYKSKCSDVNILYGCLRVKRNVNAEERIDTIPNRDEESVNNELKNNI
jgi:hypothetical protein